MLTQLQEAKWYKQAWSQAFEVKGLINYVHLYPWSLHIPFLQTWGKKGKGWSKPQRQENIYIYVCSVLIGFLHNLDYCNSEADAHLHCLLIDLFCWPFLSFMWLWLSWGFIGSQWVDKGGIKIFFFLSTTDDHGVHLNRAHSNLAEWLCTKIENSADPHWHIGDVFVQLLCLWLCSDAVGVLYFSCSFSNQRQGCRALGGGSYGLEVYPLGANLLNDILIAFLFTLWNFNGLLSFYLQTSLSLLAPHITAGYDIICQKLCPICHFWSQWIINGPGMKGKWPLMLLLVTRKQAEMKCSQTLLTRVLICGGLYIILKTLSSARAVWVLMWETHRAASAKLYFFAFCTETSLQTAEIDLYILYKVYRRKLSRWWWKKYDMVPLGIRLQGNEGLVVIGQH